MDQYKKNKDIIREDYKKNLGKMFDTQGKYNSMTQESINCEEEDIDNTNMAPNRLGHLAPSIIGDQYRKERQISENNQTIKMSKESRAAYNQASGENSQNNTHSTNKLSGMSSASYSLQQIDRIYNKLMSDADKIESANVSWKNSSLKTEINSGRRNPHSGISSIRDVQTNNKQR
jgi:hypothetical protein